LSSLDEATSELELTPTDAVGMPTSSAGSLEPSPEDDDDDEPLDELDDELHVGRTVAADDALHVARVVAARPTAHCLARSVLNRSFVVTSKSFCHCFWVAANKGKAIEPPVDLETFRKRANSADSNFAGFGWQARTLAMPARPVPETSTTSNESKGSRPHAAANPTCDPSLYLDMTFVDFRMLLAL
jgi:hypothetical protein